MQILETLRRAASSFRRDRPRFVEPPATASERRRIYERDGFVAGGALAGPDLLSRLREDCEEIFSRREDPDAGIKHERIDDGAGGEFLKVYDLRLLSPAFMELVKAPQLARLLGEITGCAKMRVLLDQIQYKPATTGGWNGWHRDMPSFPFIEPFTALTAWIPLDDVTDENGCLRMVPGSHSWGDASDLAGDDWGLQRLPDNYHGHPVREVSCPMRAGHVQFHHGYTWHCSPPNPTHRPRRALAVLFFNDDAKYREGGRITFPELSEGDSMETVAPLVLET